MARPKNLKRQIIQLHLDGKTCSEISEILDCSKATVSFHTYMRDTRMYLHPYTAKSKAFQSVRQCSKNNPSEAYLQRKLITKLKSKIASFHRGTIMANHNFNADDVIKKFGETPKCYLTGKSINIHDTGSYAFDHIIPVSRGGSNHLDNLGICTAQANACKSNLTYDEFITLCGLVIAQHDSQRDESII